LKRTKIGIVDYGVGNLGSLISVLRKLNFQVTIIQSPDHFNLVDAVILPGVGSFGTCLRSLDNSNLITPIKRWSSAGNKLLGICIGMQLLATTSEEDGAHQGLDLIPGRVTKFQSEKIHIGWNEIRIGKEYDTFSNYENKCFYFNHGYVLKTDDPYQFAQSEYTEKLVAIAKSDDTWGVQFHPENSQRHGLNLLNQILRDDKNAN
jgi:glutamine amidotransferase